MTSTKGRIAADVQLADLLFDLIQRVIGHLDGRLDQLGLNAKDYWALRLLDEPMPMNELAQRMDLDPSYVTALADRLEKLELVERQSHATDRRIKNLVLTPEGRRIKALIPETLWGGSHMFSVLDETEHSRLIGLLARTVNQPS